MGVDSVSLSVWLSVCRAKIFKTHKRVHSVHTPHHNMAHSINKPLGQLGGGFRFWVGVMQ